MLYAIVLFILCLLWFYDWDALGIDEGMYDARKSKKFFLGWYDGVSDEEGVARVIWGEVEVWAYISAGARMFWTRDPTACHYTRPVGVYGVSEFDDLTKEDGDLPACTD